MNSYRKSYIKNKSEILEKVYYGRELHFDFKTLWCTPSQQILTSFV